MAVKQAAQKTFDDLIDLRNLKREVLKTYPQRD
jgi:hypothetical protein